MANSFVIDPIIVSYKVKFVKDLFTFLACFARRPLSDRRAGAKKQKKLSKNMHKFLDKSVVLCYNTK